MASSIFDSKEEKLTLDGVCEWIRNDHPDDDRLHRKSVASGLSNSQHFVRDEPLIGPVTWSIAAKSPRKARQGSKQATCRGARLHP